MLSAILPSTPCSRAEGARGEQARPQRGGRQLRGVQRAALRPPLGRERQPTGQAGSQTPPQVRPPVPAPPSRHSRTRSRIFCLTRFPLTPLRLTFLSLDRPSHHPVVPLRRLKEGSDGRVFIQGLSEITVASANQVCVSCRGSRRCVASAMWVCQSQMMRLTRQMRGSRPYLTPATLPLPPPCHVSSSLPPPPWPSLSLFPPSAFNSSSPVLLTMSPLHDPPWNRRRSR